MTLDFVPDVPRDARFFGTHETYFLKARELRGEAAALELVAAVMRENLEKSYDSMGFTKGNPKDLVRCLGERDRSVGLHVKFPEVSENRIVYEFHTDPFPGLKGKVDPRVFDATYMDFKVAYLLGDGWSYETPEHIWENGQFTRHIITKRGKTYKLPS